MTAAQWQELADAGFGAGGSRSATGGASAEAMFRDQYPSMAWMLDASAEIKNLILHNFDSTTSSFDEQVFYADLTSTDWYKSTGANARTWQALKETDPASAANRVQNKAHELGVMLGIPLSQTGYLRGLAETGFQFGMSDQQLLEWSVNAIEAGKVKGVSGLGMMGKSSMEQVKESANTWMIALDGKTQADYARHLMTGRYTPEMMEASMEARARGKWAHLAPQFDAGITPQEFFREHQATISSLMEVPAEQINFMSDDRWKKVLSYDDGNGQIRPMTITETERFVKTRDEWGGTRQAQQAGAAMAEDLMQTFGAV
jgi:hypothetical protein